MSCTKAEHEAYHRRRKAERWAEWWLRECGRWLRTPRQWRRLLRFIARLNTTAWAQLAREAKLNPPSARTRLMIIDVLADRGMVAVNRRRA